MKGDTHAAVCISSARFTSWGKWPPKNVKLSKESEFKIQILWIRLERVLWSYVGVEVGDLCRADTCFVTRKKCEIGEEKIGERPRKRRRVWKLQLTKLKTRCFEVVTCWDETVCWASDAQNEQETTSSLKIRHEKLKFLCQNWKMCAA